MTDFCVLSADDSERVNYCKCKAGSLCFELLKSERCVVIKRF